MTYHNPNVRADDSDDEKPEQAELIPDADKLESEMDKEPEKKEGPSLDTKEDKMMMAGVPEKKELPPEVEENRLLAAISYIGILFVVPLLAKNRSKFAMFHCRQGIMVFALEALLSFIAWVPNLGPFIYLLTLFISIFGFVQAYRGERWKIPLLGKYAQMLKI
jgi:uncharacterized membrane protein